MGGSNGHFAFVSHASACEALRALPGPVPRWPAEPRMLPLKGGCISTQRQFKELSARVDLAAHGIVSRPVDLLVPQSSMRSRGKVARFHVWGRTLPAGSMLRLEGSLLVSGPELTLVQLLSSQAKLDTLLDSFANDVRSQRDALAELGINEEPRVELATRWESTRRVVEAAALACEFAGTYRRGSEAGAGTTTDDGAETAAGPGAGTAKDGNAEAVAGTVAVAGSIKTDAARGTRYDKPPLMTVASLAAMEGDVPFMARRLRTVCSLAFDHSASPAETGLALMLTMPLDYGGFGLPRPQLNAPVDVSAVRGVLSDRDVVTPDFLWAERRVALEYDSAAFHGMRGYAGLYRRTQDAVRSNILTSMGYAVFRVTPGAVSTLGGLSMLARQVAVRLGVELEEPNETQTLRRWKVFDILLPRGQVKER